DPQGRERGPAGPRRPLVAEAVKGARTERQMAYRPSVWAVRQVYSLVSRGASAASHRTILEPATSAPETPKAMTGQRVLSRACLTVPVRPPATVMTTERTSQKPHSALLRWNITGHSQ